MNHCNVAVDAALKAGEILKSGFGKKMQISSKEGIQNLVTEYDNASEDAIIAFIKEKFPTHEFLGEESGRSSEKNSEPIWIIDPLDGTVNFAHSVPIFSVSIALAIGEEIQCGVVYNPMTKELFVAEKGKGSFHDDKKLELSPKKFSESLLVTGFPYNIRENPLQCIDQLAHMLKLGIPIRRLGSAALDLSYVAASRFEAYWEVSLMPWDVAAGSLIVSEAGGVFSDYAGHPRSVFSTGPMLAANPSIQKEMIKHLGAIL
jgi:myo-inositol-1(or 4)-monophosphatase